MKFEIQRRKVHTKNCFKETSQGHQLDDQVDEIIGWFVKVYI